MKIIEKNYNWNGKLSKRTRTSYITVHHAAASVATADGIHRVHVISNGWAGIGYHFYVRKDGSIYTGRPIDTVGAHTSSYNSCSIGVCFEGNFDNEYMSKAQLDAGTELMIHLKKIYPDAAIKKHSQMNATACPGKNFPFDELINPPPKDINAKDAVDALSDRGIITNPVLWKNKCNTDANAQNLVQTIAQKTINKNRSPFLTTVNDIVWELTYRKIITDDHMWMKLLYNDKDLYWLAYKCVNMTTNL